MINKYLKGSNWYIKFPGEEFQYTPFKRCYYAGKKTKKFTEYLKKCEEFYKDKKFVTFQRHSYEQ